jgi:hypothetical protein
MVVTCEDAYPKSYLTKHRPWRRRQTDATGFQHCATLNRHEPSMPSKRTRRVESGDEASEAEEAEVHSNNKKPPSSSRIIVPVPDKQIDAEGNTYFEVSVLEC